MKTVLLVIMSALIVVLSATTLVACKKGGETANAPEQTLDKKIGAHVMISDGLHDLSASAGLSVVDPKTAIAYTAYLSSETHFGESSEIVKVAKYNVMQPTNIEWVTVFDYEKDFGGSHLSEVNIFNLNDETVRVYSVNMGNYNLYYKDVNKKTLEVGELKEVKFRLDYKSEPMTLSKDNLNEQVIVPKGGTPFVHLQLTTEIVKVDRTYYATICGGNNMKNILFIKTTDGETWTFVSMIEHEMNYEAMLAYHDYKFWIMFRKGGTYPTDNKQQNLMYSADEGKTWTLSNLSLETSDTRPYMFNYQGDLYMAYSSPLDLTYSTVRPWRCNVHVGKIVSKDGVETFEEVVYKESKYGIVYYSFIDWYGKMIMIYSSGELHPEEGKLDGFTQGKDCLNYTIVHEQDPILKLRN